MNQENRRPLSKIIWWLLLLLFGLIIIAAIWAWMHKQEDASALPADSGLSNQTMAAPHFSASGNNNRVSLAGVLPAQSDIKAIAAAAASRYSVDNQMSVGKVASAPWLSKLPGLFTQLGQWSQWQLDISASGARFSGTAKNAEAVTALREGYLANFPGLEFAGQVAPGVVAVTADQSAVLAGTANFATGSAVLSAQARALLDRASARLESNSSTVLSVAGHADSRGSEHKNQVLSQARAQAVVDYLVAAGIDGRRLRAIGYGESQPIADNATAAGRAKNRRSDFEVKPETTD